MRQFLIMAIQATAILAPTWLMHIEHPNEPLLGFLFINFVLVAFLTGVTTHLIDRFRLRRRPVAHVEQTESESLRPRAIGGATRQLGKR
jgi:hypothetical protein